MLIIIRFVIKPALLYRFLNYRESNPSELHRLILRSKKINEYNEAKSFPYTSLKYHILLACALYQNFLMGFKISDLYLAENALVDSEFQIILRLNECEWAIIPRVGMSRIWPRFDLTWVRRTQESSIGGDRTLDGLLSRIKSWSAALATIEEYFDTIK